MDLEKVTTYYNVTQPGNFEGSNILYVSSDAQRDENLPADTGRNYLTSVRRGSGLSWTGKL